jgi:hypothetical protein
VSRITDQIAAVVQASELGINGGPRNQRKLDMGQIDQTEKAKPRDLSLEEMEQVSGSATKSLAQILREYQLMLYASQYTIYKGPLT